MYIFAWVLTVLGFVIPAVAAVWAYVRSARRLGELADPERGWTWDDFDNLGQTLASLWRAQLDALKWPVLWALLGAACSTAAGVLALTVRF